jgi:hypothetical protein
MARLRILLCVISIDRMRQENASAQQNKKSYSKLDHQAHHVAPGLDVVTDRPISAISCVQEKLFNRPPSA